MELNQGFGDAKMFGEGIGNWQTEEHTPASAAQLELDRLKEALDNGTITREQADAMADQILGDA